jgi:hypothetical protein
MRLKPFDHYTVGEERNLVFKLNKAELIVIESGLQLVAIEWKDSKVMEESVEDAHYTLMDLIKQEDIQRRAIPSKELEEKQALGRG